MPAKARMPDRLSVEVLLAKELTGYEPRWIEDFQPDGWRVRVAIDEGDLEVRYTQGCYLAVLKDDLGRGELWHSMSFNTMEGALKAFRNRKGARQKPARAAPSVWLRQVDAGTDNACWHVCAKDDPGAILFTPHSGE